jgi:hypothetical protein
VIPVTSTVLTLGAIDADCGSPQFSSQINVDRDELNLVLPEAINSVAQGDGSRSVIAENHTWEFAWQTVASHRQWLEARKSLFGQGKAIHPAA